MATIIRTIFLFGFIFVCHIALADEQIPSWVKKPPIEDGLHRYYVGRATGDLSERELFNQAYEDAKNAAISENFGVLTQISKQSYETLDSSTSVNRINETSKQIVLKKFQKSEQYLNGNSVWVLYKYPKSEITAEIKRLELTSTISQSVEFSELNATSNKNGGVLEIVTTPSDVNITVDNQNYGLAPIRLRVSAEAHTVLLDHAFYEHSEEQVVVNAGATSRINKILVRAKRKVLIKSQPEQASVELGGKYLGLSPVQTEVVAGERLSLLINHAETMPYKSEVEIGKGSDVHIINVPSLTMKPSYLSINSIPQRADVFLSGKLIGKTSTGLIEVKSGTLEIKKDGYVLHEQLVNIRGGEKRILPTIHLVSISNEEKRLIEAEKRRNNFYGGLFEIGSGSISGKSMSVIAAGGFVEKTIWSNTFGVRGSLSYKYGIGGQKYSAADAYENNISGFEASIAAPIYLKNFFINPEGGIFSGTFTQKSPTQTGPIVDTANLTTQSTSVTQSFFGASVGYQQSSWGVYSGYRKYGSLNGLEGMRTFYFGLSYRGKW